MIAGTIGVLETATNEPLEDYYSSQGDRLPALVVDRTQTSLDGGPVQAGQAAGRVDVTTRDVTVAHTREGDPGGIMIEREDTRETVVSEWVADPTMSGLVAASTLAGPQDDPFPFNLIRRVAGRRVVRQCVDVRDLHLDWRKADALGDVWMVGSESSEGASIEYHGRADRDVRPTIGMGFERPWNGSVVRGVVYASGYVAAYSVESPEAFTRFVADELLAYCGVPEEGEESAQQTLDGDGGDD